MIKKLAIAALLTVLMIVGTISPAFAASATVSTSMQGSNVTITVNDGDDTFTEVVQYQKNATQTYDVEGYTVQIEYNGSGVKKATIVSTPSAAPGPNSSNPPEPKPGVAIDGSDMTWNANDQATAAASFVQSNSKDKALPSTALQPGPSNKSDASGDKIPSNAHSGDYPGLYFYWNDKQKDDGILKVDPAIFDLFEGGLFYITAKNSDAYWDYQIIPSEGIATSDGYLLFQVPRYFMYTQAGKNGKVEVVNDELKNINMIFIGGQYKDAKLIIEKDWFDEDGIPITDESLIAELNDKLVLSGNYKLGENTITIDNFHDAYFGKKVTVLEGPIAGYEATANPLSAKVKFDDDPIETITFENTKQYAYIEIEKLWDLLPGSVAPEVVFNICDMEDNLVYEGVALGTYQVKEGSYKVVEIEAAGFTADNPDQTIIVEAGKTGIVTFKNTEDRATFTIRKEWEGADELGFNEADLNKLVSFGAYKIGAVNTVKAGSVIKISESFKCLSWVSADGTTRYTISFVAVSVNGEQKAVNSVKFTADKDAEIEVVFTNTVTAEDITASLSVTKEWLSTGDKTVDELNELISFNPGLGTEAGLVPGTAIEGIGEDIDPDDLSWVSLDGKTRYTIVQVGVSVDGVEATSLTIAEKGEHSIVFTNKVVKEDISARMLVVKVWQATGDKSERDLNKMISFKPGLGLRHGLVPGVVIDGIGETVREGQESWVSADGKTRYTIEQVSVLVDGEEATSLTIAEKGSHCIVFTNTVTAEDITASLSVTKEWLSTGDMTEEELNELISFNPGLGQQAGLVPGTVIEGIGETVREGKESWLSSDGKTRYTIEQVSILVDGEEVTSLTIAEKGEHSIVFTNQVVEEHVYAEPEFTVLKEWQDEYGNQIKSVDFTLYQTKGVGSMFYRGSDAITLGESNEAVAGETVVVSEVYPKDLILVQSNPTVNVKVDLDIVTVTNNGVAVEFERDGDSISFVAEGDGDYLITFTNKVYRIDYPTRVTGKIYKGPENYKDTPKDKATGDSTNPGQFFNNKNSPNGRSLDTIYVTIEYFSESLQIERTLEFWYPFMDPPTGSGKYFDVYIDDLEGTGYFHLRLSLYNRSPSRDINNSHGKWYMDLSIELFEFMGHFEGKAPAMVPPVPTGAGFVLPATIPLDVGIVDTEESLIETEATDTEESYIEPEVTEPIEDIEKEDPIIEGLFDIDQAEEDSILEDPIDFAELDESS
ncbi:MAG: hypothetical protein FWH40_03095 [Coriobacteriia bacterium]|nr:hypothetical protein [Coriobacteriia bacterium]